MLQEMLASGDYVRQTFLGSPILGYPFVPYWLAAPFSALVPGEIGLRLSSALASLGVLVVVYLTSMRLWPHRGAAAAATILLAGSPIFHVYMRTFMTDPPFVLAMAITVAATALAQTDKRWVSVALIALGGAVACKSIAAGIPAVALLPWLWRPMREAGLRAVSRAVGIAAAIALPYFVITFWLYGERFIQEHFIVNLVGRSSGSYGSNQGLGGGVIAYLQWLPRVEGPFTTAWLALGTLGSFTLGWLTKERRLQMLGVYSIAVVLLYSLVNTRLLHYLLPIYPAAALGVAGAIALAAKRWPVLSRPSFALVAPVLAVVVLLASSRYPGGTHALLESPAGRDLGRIAAKVAAPEEPIYALEWYGPSLAYYSNRPVRLLTADKRRYAAIALPFLLEVDVPHLVPPPPVPVGTRMLVAGPVQDLSTTPWLHVDEVLGHSPPHFLTRATVVTPKERPVH
jgi:4-amino-4-deoxy-L-arabinose transferase-like glycosyltransferase